MKYDSTQGNRTTDLGLVRINNDAISTIASIAAMEVRGVYKMGGGIKGTLYEVLFRRSATKGVRIHAEENEMKLTVSIIVEYGVDIPHAVDEVQSSVKRAVERMTALVLSEVNVIVEGVHSPSGLEKKR